MAATVRVRGRAVVPGEPDEVRVSLTITALERTPEEAMQAVARRSEEMEAILGEVNVPRTGRSTTGVSVREEREYERDRYRHKGYRASNRVTVRLEDASVLGRLMNEATSRADAQIQGPWWQIRLDNPARAEACRQAAAEARRKAQAYAEALGAGLGEVVRVSEPGLETRTRGHEPMAAMVMAEPTSRPEVEVEAGELDVAAAVDVTFRLEQG